MKLLSSSRTTAVLLLAVWHQQSVIAFLVQTPHSAATAVGNGRRSSSRLYADKPPPSDSSSSSSSYLGNLGSGKGSENAKSSSPPPTPPPPPPPLPPPPPPPSDYFPPSATGVSGGPGSAGPSSGASMAGYSTMGGTTPLGGPSTTSAPGNVQRVFASNKSVKVQGNTLKTWSYGSAVIDRLQVCLKTEGRPLEADVDLWQGPDNTPQRMKVYIENGVKRPFNCVIETPKSPNSVAVRNTANMQFPLQAVVTSNDVENGPAILSSKLPPVTVQGGALRTYPFDVEVESVQVLLKTDGRPLTAKIELLEGPNNKKMQIELYTEDGLTRPFYCIMETPGGTGYVVRLINTAPLEFPLSAWVEAYKMGSATAFLEPVIGGDR